MWDEVKSGDELVELRAGERRLLIASTRCEQLDDLERRPLADVADARL